MHPKLKAVLKIFAVLWVIYYFGQESPALGGFVIMIIILSLTIWASITAIKALFGKGKE